MKKVVRHIIGIGLGAGLLLVTGAYAYVSLTYRRDFSAVPLPQISASRDPKVIEHGAYLTHAVAHCSACHGNGASTNHHELPAEPYDLRGGYVLDAGPFGVFYPVNLTSDPETGIARLTDQQLARAIRHGVKHNGEYAPLMAFAVGPMSDEDLTAIVSYLRTVPAIKNRVPEDEWGFLAKVLSGRFNPRMTQSRRYVPPAEQPSAARGEYLANGPALCFGCHTPMDPTQGFAEVGPRFSGGAEAEPDTTDERYEVLAPNLTPDPETGALYRYSEQAFIDRIRKVGAVTRGSPMPWDNFKQMTDCDLKSIYAYLSSLPPVRRQTGPSRRLKGWTPEKG